MATYEQEIKEILGDEFDVRVDSSTLDVEFGIRLGCITHTSLALLRNNPTHEVLRLERDKIIINLKRKVTKLLWKYLGDVGRDY